MTQAGMILGTAAYMSAGAGARQSRGQTRGHLGVWLRAVRDADRARELRRRRCQPSSWRASSSPTPIGRRCQWIRRRSVRPSCEGCLQKDPEKRLRDIGDVRLALEGAFDPIGGVAFTPQPAAHPSVGWRRALPWIAGLVVGSIVTGLAGWAILGTPWRSAIAIGAPILPSRFPIPINWWADLASAISPDGQTLVYRARRNGVLRLVSACDAISWKRRHRRCRRLPRPFFSPDGQWIGFEWAWTAAATTNTLKKVAACSGGPSETRGRVRVRQRAGEGAGADVTIILGDWLTQWPHFASPAGRWSKHGAARQAASNQVRLWQSAAPSRGTGGPVHLKRSAFQHALEGLEHPVAATPGTNDESLLAGYGGAVPAPSGHLVFTRRRNALGGSDSISAVWPLPQHLWPTVEGIRDTQLCASAR